MTFDRLHSGGIVLSMLSVCLSVCEGTVKTTFYSLFFIKEKEHFHTDISKADYKDGLTKLFLKRKIKS